MTIAVERIGVGHRGVLRRILRPRVIVVTDEIRASLHLRRVGAEQSRIRWRGARRGGRGKGSRSAGTAEVRMREIDARVQVGDFDVFPMQTGRALPRARRADERHAVGVVDVISPDRLNRDDAGQRRQAADLIGRRANLDAVDRVLECREHLGTLGLGGCNDPLLLRAQIGLDRLSIGLGDLLAGHPAAHNSDRIVSQLENDDAFPSLPQGNGG